VRQWTQGFSSKEAVPIRTLMYYVFYHSLKYTSFSLKKRYEFFVVDSLSLIIR